MLCSIYPTSTYKLGAWLTVEDEPVLEGNEVVRYRVKDTVVLLVWFEVPFNSSCLVDTYPA